MMSTHEWLGRNSLIAIIRITGHWKIGISARLARSRESERWEDDFFFAKNPSAFFLASFLNILRWEFGEEKKNICCGMKLAKVGMIDEFILVTRQTPRGERKGPRRTKQREIFSRSISFEPLSALEYIQEVAFSMPNTEKKA